MVLNFCNERILQYRVTCQSKDECISAIVGWLETDVHGKFFICANPHSLVTANVDPEFEKCFEQADLTTPDGIGIVYASKILKGKINQRITGSDIFHGLSKKLNIKAGEGYSYFFLGSTKETLQRIKQNLAEDYPNVRYAGSYSPPYKVVFSDDDNREIIEAINAAKPDILWVGMTAPKQDKWILKHKDKLNVKFIGAIGAVFDFYAGNIRRSHPFFQETGLEWLPRLLREPKRLWRRNFISTPKFILKVITQKFKI